MALLPRNNAVKAGQPVDSRYHYCIITLMRRHFSASRYYGTAIEGAPEREQFLLEWRRYAMGQRILPTLVSTNGHFITTTVRYFTKSLLPLLLMPASMPAALSILLAKHTMQKSAEVIGHYQRIRLPKALYLFAFTSQSSYSKLHEFIITMLSLGRSAEIDAGAANICRAKFLERRTAGHGASAMPRDAERVFVAGAFGTSYSPKEATAPPWPPSTGYFFTTIIAGTSTLEAALLTPASRTRVDADDFIFVGRRYHFMHRRR